jgi:hypothetical protein
MVPVLITHPDARTRQGYYCSIRRLNRYCCAVVRHAGSNRISFALKTFGLAAQLHFLYILTHSSPVNHR